jgi:hypothetical protein
MWLWNNLLMITLLGPTARRLLKTAHDCIYNLRPLRSLANKGAWDKLEEAGHALLLQKKPQQKALELITYSLQQSGRLNASAAIAVKATALFPKCWTFHFLAGLGLKASGRGKEACKYFRQAAAISPHNDQTIKELIHTIASTDGLDLAAAEYIHHRSKIGTNVDICIAPVSSVSNWIKKNDLPMLHVGEVEKIPFKSPNVWGKPQSIDNEYAFSNTPYVADIKNAQIFSNSSLILTPDGTVLSDTAGHPDFGHIVNFIYEKVVLAQLPNKVLLDLSKFKVREINEGIFLSGLGSSAFGHWLPEFLPKLQFLEKHPDFIGTPIIVDADMPKSHFDHLKRLVSNPLILLRNDESLLCKRLLVSPSPTFLPIEIFPNDIPVNKLPGLSPRAMKFLCKNELREIPSPYRRIFLARKNMRWRRLLNEDEIARDLKTLGFESIFIEEMSVPEQILLFQQAQWIVAPNGSALLNVIFANTNVKLLILSQPNLHNWGTFQGPMEALGYQPLFICGNFTICEGSKHSDYQVPLDQIRLALRSQGMVEA